MQTVIMFLRTLFLPLVLLLALLAGCKKEKTFIVNGRLLQSRSQPAPVPAYTLRLFQQGSGGAPIALGASSSLAEGQTDNNGFFRIRFKEGKGTFFGIPVSNQNEVTLSGVATGSFPEFYVSNLPYQQETLDQTLYLYKRVDTIFLRLKAVVPVLTSDSFTIYAHQVYGRIKRIKTGFAIPAHVEFILDTIHQAAFTHYAYVAGKYVNDFSIYKNRHLMPLQTLSAEQDSLPPNDESRRTFHYIVY